jgi:hypothetical protein
MNGCDLIAAFIADKMSAYIAGGMRPETAARFTRGELLAIYKGDHYSRDVSWTMRVTPPPKNLDIKTVMKKADAAIMEILKYCVVDTKREAKAPEKTPLAHEKTALSGFEKMTEYARKPA